MATKDELKQKIDIVDFIGSQIPLKRSGRNFSGLCPFHREKTPSFHVSSERQIFKCFGCGKSGDIFTFYQEREGVTFFEALKDLAKIAGVELDSFQPSDEYNQKQRLLELNLTAAKLFNFLLTKHHIGKNALTYITHRGITQSQIKDFQIGYAPDAWHTALNFLVQKKKFKPEELELVGLAIKSSNGWYDRFRGRIMFPLTDHRGNIVGFSGRVLPDLDDGKSGKYINTPETALYHKSQLLFPLYYLRDRIRETNSIVIVEGEFDVLSSIRAGVDNVVAVKGSALTNDQASLIKRFADNVVLSLDADSAGVAAAKRAITVLQTQELNTKVVEIPKGKDPDELAKSDPKTWREAVKQAVSIYDFFIDVALRQYDKNTIDGSKQISAELLPIFAKIENKIEQDHYLKKLADILQTAKTVVENEMERVLRKSMLNPNLNLNNKPVAKTNNRINGLLDELLTIIIHNWDEINKLIKDKEKLNFEQQLLDFPKSAVTDIISQLIKTNPQDIVKFAAKLPSQLQPKFDDCFLKDSNLIPPEKIPKTISNIQASIAKIELRDRLNKLRRDLTSKSAEQRSLIEQQINDVLLRFRSYND